MTLPRYAAYKDSGVEWLGEVPEHWYLKRVRHVLRDSPDGIKIGPFGSQLTSEMLVDAGYKVYGQENVIHDDFDRGTRFISGEKFLQMKVYEVFPGDLLVTMMGSSGHCKMVPSNIQPGVMDSHLLRLRCKADIEVEYLRILIDESAYVAHQTRLMGKGSIMHGLNSSVVKELLIAVPPIYEQRKIKRFLDHETSKIDTLIAEQQNLISLLKEKRQAVISHAVTKGLDPDVPMNDSGVEWLGDVPEHWHVAPLKYLATMRSGGTPNKSNLQFWDGGIPWASAKDLKSEFMSDTIDHLTVEALEVGAAELIPANAVLVVVRGMILARTFPTTLTTAAMAINQDLKGLISRGRVTARFLLRVLQASSVESMSRVDEAGHGTKALRMDAWTSIPLPVPPIDEQEAITRFLDRETSSLDLLTAEATHAINLLLERRSALISATVTGKIDVRGLVRQEAA